MQTGEVKQEGGLQGRLARSRTGPQQYTRRAPKEKTER